MFSPRLRIGEAGAGRFSFYREGSLFLLLSRERYETLLRRWP
jgi:hypothetical protein